MYNATPDVIPVNAENYYPNVEKILLYNIPPDKMAFNGVDYAVVPGGIAEVMNKEGSFTISVLSKAVLTAQYHYLWCQNWQGANQKEKFFRYKNVGGIYKYQFGFWINNANHMIDIAVPNDDKNKWLMLTAIYDAEDNGGTLQLFRGNEKVASVSGMAQYDPGKIDDSEWYIGAHLFPGGGGSRLFNGILPHAKIFHMAMKLWVVLDIDSDGNGYIHSPAKNSKGTFNEISNRITKPRLMTYYDANKCTIADVPLDYRRIPLRVNFFTAGITAGAQFKFEYSDFGSPDTPNESIVRVYKKSDGTEVPTDWTDINGSNKLEQSTIKTTADATDGTFDDNYYIETVTTSGKIPKEVTITLRIKCPITSGGVVTPQEVSSSIKVNVQEAASNGSPPKYDWIVPGGWKIEDGIKFTTPIPTIENVIGPQTEGSGSVGSAYDNKGGDQSITNPRGDVFSVDTYDNGFLMALKFSFVRSPHTQNRPGGYVRPDYSGGSASPNPGRNEKYDDPPSANADRQQMDFFGNSGIKFFGKEILIFDIRALKDGLALGGDSFGADGKIKDKTVDGNTYKGLSVCNTLPGNLYLGQPDTSKNAAQFDAAYNALKVDPTEDNDMTIDVTKNGNVYRVTTAVNGIPVCTNVDLENITNDRRIFIQSHWGSGVKIKVVSLTKK
ncbi:MAG: hypothetical protein LBC74_06555 [Planctomycetaceae bacterium]|nr:hypothetical protein [Planctomycetaceae bacterium]